MSQEDKTKLLSETTIKCIIVFPLTAIYSLLFHSIRVRCCYCCSFVLCMLLMIIENFIRVCNLTDVVAHVNDV